MAVLVGLPELHLIGGNGAVSRQHRIGRFDFDTLAAVNRGWVKGEVRGQGR